MNASINHSRIAVDLKNNPTHVTWNADRSGILVRVSSKGVDLTLELGPDVVAQLKQALSWAGQESAPRLRIYEPELLAA